MKNNLFVSFLFILTAIVLWGCNKDSQPSIKSVPVSSSNSTVDNSLELTPFGLVPKSRIFTIENGYELNIKDGHMMKIEKRTGQMITDIGTYHPVRDRIVEGDTRASDNTFRSFDSSSGPTPNPSNPNWIVFTKWNNTGGTPISYFSTTWTVPNPPAQDNGQVLYIFNGLEDASLTNIIQPVLRWQSNAWQISNWYAYKNGTDSVYVNSGYTTVSPGTSLQGVITYTGQKTDGSNNFTSTFSGTSNTLTITETRTVGHPTGVPFIPQQTWAFEALEAYNTHTFGSPVPSDGIDYPSDVLLQMTSISIATGATHPTMTWTPVNNVTGFGQHVDVISNSSTSGEVDIKFHALVPTFTISYAGHGSFYNFNIVPNLSPVVTSVIYFKDLNTGISNSDAGAPTSIQMSLIAGHTYQIYITCYGPGTSLTSYTQTYTPLI